jgi:5-amino-6-(5-phosphoribosylamino)uracil reductase
VQRLWPIGGGDEIGDDELAELYAYPPDRPCVRVNFVSSIDGAVTVDGRSGGLSSPADRRVFGLLRELCEVVLVGSGTAVAENYRGARRASRLTGRPPRIAVVTGRAALDPNGPLFTDTRVPPLILTTTAAPAENLGRLAAAGAEIDTRGTEPADLRAALHERGLTRVLCEGGPTLFGTLLAADAVDELCLSVSPLLAAGHAGRISSGPPVTSRMRLASAVTEADLLLLRYQRSTSGSA